MAPVGRGPAPCGTWRQVAEQLAETIAAGGDLPVLVSLIPLQPGEVPHAAVDVHGWRFVPVDVTYPQRRGVAVGGVIVGAVTAAAALVENRRVRAQAERLAAPGWRPLGPLSLLATSDRLVVSNGGAPASVWYDAIRQLRPELDRDRLELFFEDDPPYLLEGPAVPYLAVVVATALAARVGTEAVASALLPS